jgi:uncharacterized protein (TIGR02598 family)
VNAIPPVEQPCFRYDSKTHSLVAKSRKGRIRAFTLIETVMAIGIISFALIGILGLMPAGMVTFQRAMDTSMSSHIVQQVVSNLQQGSFSDLSQQQPILYFDDQGNRLTGASESGVQALYYVNTVVQTPAALPGGPSSSLASVTVEIVKNPSHRDLPRDPGTLAVVNSPNLSVSRFPVLISSQID